MHRSLRGRLLAAFAIVIALSLFLSASGFVLLLREQQVDSAEQRIGLLVAPLTQRAGNMELNGWPRELMREDLEQVAGYYDIRILLLDNVQRVVIDTDVANSMLGERLDLPAATPTPEPQEDGRPAGSMSSFHTVRTNAGGEDLYLFTTAAERVIPTWPPWTPQMQLVIAVPAGDVTSAWAALLPRLSVAGLSAAVVAVVAATLLASRITKPIAQMTRASEAMARGDLQQRIDDAGSDEVGALASAFNQMSAQVARSNRAMRDLLANVSHELKTPLTSIQGFSQAMVDGMADDREQSREMAAVIHDEAERIRALVDDLLYLSEIESGTLQLNLDAVDVDAVVSDTARRFRYLAEQQDIEIRLAPAAGEIRADGRRLEQVLANLVDNAIRYAPAGTEVLLRTYLIGDDAAIEVHNGGGAIAPDHLPHVFDRFYQVDPSRSDDRHSGLGLAIVHELVQAHEGQAVVESSTDSGTVFTVRLPVAGPASDRPRRRLRAREQAPREPGQASRSPGRYSA
ncbi:MAG: HAMP domain-containing protein [Dehalococcoidia bacterium]|nr:HAMP domain-containing protein [Dehalococcoidia bacterium]